MSDANATNNCRMSDANATNNCRMSDAYVTNNSRKKGDDVSEKLTELGLRNDADSMTT